jgi:hypothetical protein
MKKLFYLLLSATIFLSGCCCTNQKSVCSKTEKNRDEYLVGISYFAGWWEQTPNKWQGQDGKDWRDKYSNRIPLLGQYNDQQTMDKEIIAASSYGVDFFAILWYPVDANNPPETHAVYLNRGLDNFINSKEAHRMKFMFEFCNHPPFEKITDQSWQKMIDETWLKAFKHPSYLRVGEKLVFKIHSGDAYYSSCNQDTNLMKSRLDILRQKVKDAGLGEMLIGIGLCDSQGYTLRNLWIPQVFDFTAMYMDVPRLEQKDSNYPYKMLAEYNQSSRLSCANDKTSIMFMPYVAAGWQPRPWGDYRASFEFPNRQEWKNELLKIKQDLDCYKKLGLPIDDKNKQKIFTIYAWNEFGEGGFAAPTQGDKYMKLEGIKEIFGQ